MKKSFFKSAVVPSMVLLSAVFSSCENEQLMTTGVESQEIPVVANEIFLDPSVEDLEESDALTVANIFAKNEAISRSETPKSIKNVVTLTDKTGAPVIYAVNYDDGFILVSATKKYYPILAEVEHGSFSVEEMSKCGMEIVVGDMIDNIEIAREDKYDFKTRAHWSGYMAKNKANTSVNKSRASDDYWVAYENWWFSDGVYGNNVYYLKDCFEKEILPKEVYDRYVAAVQDEDLWEGTDYSWRWTAYVVERTVNNNKVYGPMLTTKWDQEYPYNTTDKDVLGCVTIATAQLMKYYQHPSSFAWSKMPDMISSSSEAPELTSFLSKLRTMLNVDNEGFAYSSDVKRVLTSYGYNVTEIQHDFNKIVMSLRNNKPVYARGDNSLDYKSAHAWVIDGLKDYDTRTEYVLYRLADQYYPDFQYEEAKSYEMYCTYSSVKMSHINWGWAGDFDGWFFDHAMPTFDYEEGPANYSKDRKEIVINSYK